MAVDLAELASLDLLRGIGEADLTPLARRLTPRDLPTGCTVIRQDELASSFALVVNGELVVTRTTGETSEELAVVGPGSIVGELALLRERARVATVTTRTETRVLIGDRGALLALLHLPAVAERLQELVSLRLAEDAPLVPATTADGVELVLRPLRPDDRDALTTGIEAMSDESLYRRFFTGGRPSEDVIAHLLHVDYVDHFAWVVGESASERGLGVARYNRRSDRPQVAEAAFAVVDAEQGRGLGTLMLGALAVAADAAGIDRLCAEVLADNRPMRAVLDKAGASWESVEAGVVVTEIEVADAIKLLDVDAVERLARSAREIVTAAGLALARRVR